MPQRETVLRPDSDGLPLRVRNLHQLDLLKAGKYRLIPDILRNEGVRTDRKSMEVAIKAGAVRGSGPHPVTVE